MIRKPWLLYELKRARAMFDLYNYLKRLHIEYTYTWYVYRTRACPNLKLLLFH